MSRSPAVFAALFVSLVVTQAYCRHPPAVPPQPEVILSVRSGAEVHVAVELARTEAERTRGLMYRRSLDSGKGMLFLFPQSEPLKFWMRNTYIPLDMIFLTDDRHVIYVEENAEPLTETPRGPDAPARYVLEVPGHWARTHGIEPGVVARFVGLP